MKTSSITFAQLRRLLRELHFTEIRQEKGWRFEEPESEAIFLFRPYRPDEKLSGADLMTTRTHLEWRGLLNAGAFEELLNKTPV
jgi:hypothetical protein